MKRLSILLLALTLFCCACAPETDGVSPPVSAEVSVSASPAPSPPPVSVELPPTATVEPPIVWADRVFGDLVAAALGKKTGDAVYESELADVTEISIFILRWWSDDMPEEPYVVSFNGGSWVNLLDSMHGILESPEFDNDDDYSDIAYAKAYALISGILYAYVPHRKIKTLDDLRHFPNLTFFGLDYSDVSSLEPLKNLPHLESLGLTRSNVPDEELEAFLKTLSSAQE
jgi:hypothetical protein